MESIPTAVNVQMGMMETSVKTTSMNVHQTPAGMVGHVGMVSTHTLVNADLDTMETTVKTTLINVKAIHV